MATAYGFELKSPQGVIFTLSKKAKRDRRQQFGDWDVEVRKDVAFLCARTDLPNANTPMDDMIMGGHDAAEQLLDIIAVEERTPLLCVEPHNNVAWRTSTQGLKVILTGAITCSAEFAQPIITGRDADGNLIPNPPYVPPQPHASFRYFRYSQASQNVFEAYKNMFLAFESLLDHVTPQESNENETAWLERALTEATTTRGLNLSAFGKPRNRPVQDFIDAHYSAVRCAVFHSKSSSRQSLRPGSLKDYDVVLQQLLAVQSLVEHLMKKEFNARLATSAFYHKGFGHLLQELSSKMVLLVSEGQCPTPQQLAQGAQDEDLDPGLDSHVTFAGTNRGSSDEWLFFAELKAQSLLITKVKSVRLGVPPNNHELYGPIAERFNDTLITTELDLDGVHKLIINVRCLLRNVQSQQRGFSH
jgi:hypothetical protein